MRFKLLVALVAAVAFVALLSADGASAQRTSRQANDNASSSPGKSKRVFVGRGSDSKQGSRVTITADDTLKDYSAYRSGDRFYVVLPKSAAGAGARVGSGRGYSDMQVQQRGDSVVLSYRVQPGAKPRVEQKFNRLDVVFDMPADAGQQAAAGSDASRAQQQQPPPQPTPAESRNQAANAQQNSQAQQAATPTRSAAEAAAERRAQEEAARTQAATANTAPSTVNAAAGVEQGAQNGVPPSTVPTQETATAATPAGEPQVAQAQPPAPVAPINTTQPATNNQSRISLGTFLIRNWPFALVLAIVVVGLGLVLAGRRAAMSPASIESADEDAAAKPEGSRAARAKEASAEALRDASAAAQASTLNTAKASRPSAAEASTLGTAEASTPSTVEAAGADLKPLVAVTALAGGAAVAKSRKQSRKEARQDAKRKKKGAPADVPVVEEPVAEEPAAVETLVHEVMPVETTAAVEPVVEEVAQEEPAEVTQTVSTEEVAEVVTLAEVAEHSVTHEDEAVESTEIEVAEPAFVANDVAAEQSFDTKEVVPAEAEAVVPFVAEQEAPAPVAEIEPAFAPDHERVQAETRRLFEGEAYDRAVVGTRDPVARQIIAAELLSALAGRNALRRERAGRAFVEHGYFEETERDLREADAPAERSAAARSLALLGDRAATPQLVAALEDPVTDVRRAAVEALGALRDPAAVAPLEALLERERNERNRIPTRVIRNAVEFCREGLFETPTAETPTVEAHTVEAPTADVAAAPKSVADIEPAPVAEAEQGDATTTEVMPFEEVAVETEPAPAVEVAAPEPFASEPADETAVSITPFVEERDEAAPLIESAPVAEATGEPAHVPEAVPFVGEAPEAAAETGVQPFVEEEERPAALEEVGAHATEEIEPFAEPSAETHTPQPFESATHAAESTQAALFDEDAAEVTREVESAPASSSKELAPSEGEAAPGEWFDFDMGEMSNETQPSTAEPSSFEPTAFEPAPFFDARTETTRDLEVSDEAEPAAAVLQEQAPAAPRSEKGISLFDETSTVPASIQQRLASSEPDERAAAIVELSHVDTDEAFQQICSAFDDEAREVRSAAARALYELRSDRADSFTRALREATPERRREIGAAIATSGLAGESISQLTGESRERTYESFSLLFLMAKAGEVQPLLRAIEGHPNNEVRLAVVKLLALSGQKEILPAFRRLAVRGSLPTEVRSAVMEAIYQISSSQPTPA